MRVPASRTPPRGHISLLGVARRTPAHQARGAKAEQNTHTEWFSDTTFACVSCQARVFEINS